MSTQRTDLVIGIDLGTTHSLIATVRPGNTEPEILETREARRLLPSVVWKSKDGKTETGYKAKAKRLEDPAHTFYSFKRVMGMGGTDLPKIQQSVSYPVFVDSHNRILLGLEAEGGISPLELSAAILKELKLSAEKSIGAPIEKAVITVPAYFSDAQRQETRMAARLAGLEVLRILNEPTAAALAYGLQRTAKTVLVYDLGGGTFDVSVLRLEDGVFEVLATRGNTRLGGDDIDDALLEYFLGPKAKTKQNTDFINSMRLSCEEAKKAFSIVGRESVQFTVDGKSFSIVRRDFDRVLSPILDETLSCVSLVLKDAELSIQEIDEVVLVGGPTRLLALRERVALEFGKSPHTHLNPDEVVALGAAVQGEILMGRRRDALLLDVVPLSLGIETYGGLTSVLIPRNSKIPTRASETFTTFVDFQTGVDIHVVQGEREPVELNRSLARLKLSGIEPQPAGFPRVEVVFSVDVDGVLQVFAKDLKSGLEKGIQVKPTYGFTEEEFQKLAKTPGESASGDMKFRQWIEVMRQTEPFLRALDRNWSQAERFFSADAFLQLEKMRVDLKQAMAQKDSEKTQNLRYSIESFTKPFAEWLMESVAVTFLPMNQTVQGRPDQTILEVAIENDIPLQHACGGFCACTTCQVFVKQGETFLSPMEDDEEDRLDRASGVTLRSRLGCQAKLQKGSVPIVVEIQNEGTGH